MKTTIFKYLTGSENNYFYRVSSLSLVDKIEFNRSLEDSFPIFREEWYLENEVNILKTGYFDIKLSLLMSERSSSGNTVFGFFEELLPSLSKYKFIVVCESSNPERSYSGVIDNSQINADMTIRKNEYYINLSVTGIEAELIDIMKSLNVSRLDTDKIFETEFLPRIFYDIDPLKGQLKISLNMYEKLAGRTLKISRDIWNKIWDQNLDVTGTFCTIKNWDAFESFLKGYSLRFKVVYKNSNEFGPVFEIKIYFRSDGSTHTSVGKLMSKNISYLEFGSDNLAILYSRRTDGQNPDIDHYTGFIMNRTNIYYSTTTQDILLNKKENIYSISGFSIPARHLNIIALSFYNGNLIAGDTALCRAVSDPDAWYSLMRYLANIELNYLLKNTKSRINISHAVSDNSNVMLDSTADIEGKRYSCHKINSYDPFYKRMETEWVEL